MDTSITVEFILYGISILAGFLVYRLSKSADKKIDLTIGLIIMLIGFFITSFVSMRFFQLKRILENQNFIEVLKNDNEALKIASDLSESKGLINQENNNFFNSVLNEQKADFGQFLDDFKNKKLVYYKQDFPQFEKDVVKIFSEGEMNQIILATSRVDYNQWWKKESFGDEYTKANFDCIKNKKTVIKRIWIFDNEEEKQQKLETLKAQKNAGIETYYVFNNDIKDIIERKRDIIVVGDKYAGELILNERDMSKVIFYFDNLKIKEIKKDWDELSKKAKRF